MKKGWEYKKLGEVCEIYQPKTISSKDLIPNGKYKVYGANGIIGRFDRYNHEESEVLLCCRGATCGAINESEPLSWINGNAMVIKPKSQIIAKPFLKYQLIGLDFSKVITGAAQPQITRKTLSPTIIGFPPLSEQQRIVTYLDSTFAKIDAVAKNAEKSLNDAKALFQSALAKMMEPKEGWEEKYLDELAENLDYKRIPVTLNKRKSGKYPYYGASGIVDYVEDYIFDGNYLLISEDGANLLARATPIAFPVTGKFWVNNHAHILEFKDSITQLFVEFYFKLIDIKEYVTGAAQPKLTQRNMNKIPIFIPSLDKQKIVVCALQNIESKVQQLQSNLTRTLSECAALKQSILRQTFE